MRMRLIFMLAMSVFIGALARSGLASVLTDAALADGVQDVLSDSSKALLDDNGAPGLSVGDVLYGFAQISGVSPDFAGAYPPDASTRLIIVFSAEIKSVSGTTFTLGKATSGSHKLSDLLPASLDPKFGRKSGDEIAVVISGPKILSSLSAADFAGGSAFDSGYKYEATIGLADLANDFFEVDFVKGAGTRNELGGFSVLDASGSYGNGPGIEYLPATNPDDGTTLKDFSGTLKRPEVGFVSTIFSVPGEYDYNDIAKFSINAVPEPASVAVWSLLAIGCVAFGRRRLSRKAA